MILHKAHLLVLLDFRANVAHVRSSERMPHVPAVTSVNVSARYSRMGFSDDGLTRGQTQTASHIRLRSHRSHSGNLEVFGPGFASTGRSCLDRRAANFTHDVSDARLRRRAWRARAQQAPNCVVLSIFGTMPPAGGDVDDRAILGRRREGCGNSASMIADADDVRARRGRQRFPAADIALRKPADPSHRVPDRVRRSGGSARCLVSLV